MLPLPLDKDGFVRCGNCGFLSSSMIVVGKGLITREISFRTRQIGNVEGPACSVGSPVFKITYPTPGVDLSPADMLKEISKEIVCSFYVEYRPLHTPKEHAELRTDAMIREESARRDKEMRDWQAQQKEVERKWQEDQKAAEKVWQLEQKQDDRAFQVQQAGINRQWAIATGAFIAVISTIVGYLLKR